MSLAHSSVVCLILTLFTAASGIARDPDSGPDSAALAQDIAQDSVTSIFLLGAEDEGECGPPLLQAGHYAVWGSIFPEYRQKYGFAVRLGFMIVDDRNRDLVLGIAYNRREDLIQFYQALTIPWRSGKQSSLAVRQWLHNRDGRLGAGMSLRWGASQPGNDAAWLTADLGFSRTAYYTLRSLPVGLWPQGRAVTLWETIGLDLERRLPGLIGALAGSISLTQGVRGLGGEFAFSQIEMAGAFERPHVLLWAAGGWSSGDVPEQSLFDLAAEGRLLGQPLWLWRGGEYRAVGASTHVRLYGAAHGLWFVTHARLASPVAQVCEAGFGVGLSHGTGQGRLAWKLRIDFPFCSAASHDSRRALDVRRVSVRIWLWPHPSGLPGAPESDYRSVLN